MKKYLIYYKVRYKEITDAPYTRFFGAIWLSNNETERKKEIKLLKQSVKSTLKWEYLKKKMNVEIFNIKIKQWRTKNGTTK